MNDQAPAADQREQALAAFERVLNVERGGSYPSVVEHHADLATIRAALADRITPAEARIALDWSSFDDGGEDRVPMPPDRLAFIARLGKIAEAGDAHH